MPFKSKSQQRFMFAKHPKIAKEFAAHTPDIKSLPEHVKQSSLESADSFTKIAKALLQINPAAIRAIDNDIAMQGIAQADAIKNKGMSPAEHRTATTHFK